MKSEELLQPLESPAFAFFASCDISLIVRAVISSLPVDLAESPRAIRSHWGIENKLHWILDVQFGEDGSRVRNADAAQNLNVIRKVAVDLLRRDRTTRHTFKKRRQIMMWKDEIFQHIIIGR